MTQASKLVVLHAFGNDFSPMQSDLVLPELLGRLHDKATMLTKVTIDAKDEANKVGDEITVTKQIEFDGVKIQTTAPSTPTDVNLDSVKMKLDRHIYQEFVIFDTEHAAMRPGKIPDAILGAADALAYDINSSAFNCYKEVANTSGLIGSQNIRTKDDFIEARRRMNELRVWSGRNLVLSNDTAANTISLFTAGNDQKAEVEGEIGRRYSFDIFEDNQVPMHYAGSASTDAGLKTSVGAAVGSTLLILTGATPGATFKVGDSLKVAGSKQTFSVAADVDADGAGKVDVYLFNPVAVPIPAGASVSVAGDHDTDMAFSSSAFLLAFRKLTPSAPAVGVNSATMTHPHTGMTLRLTSWYDPTIFGTHYKLDTLYGAKAIAPERALRFGGH